MMNEREKKALADKFEAELTEVLAKEMAEAGVSEHFTLVCSREGNGLHINLMQFVAPASERHRDAEPSQISFVRVTARELEENYDGALRAVLRGFGKRVRRPRAWTGEVSVDRAPDGTPLRAGPVTGVGGVKHADGSVELTHVGIGSGEATDA